MHHWGFDQIQVKSVAKELRCPFVLKVELKMAI